MKDKLDFIVIGAQKAGTSSLYEHLRQHPEIWLPAAKEAPFFSHDSVFKRGFDTYLKAVGFSGQERRWGTVTPQYMVGGVYERGKGKAAAAAYDERTVPLRIHECLPDVRLVAILRDPVERARSHHQMMVMNRFEERSFDEAVEQLLRPESLADSRKNPDPTTGYVTWGEYGRILAGYFSVFPAEQLLVLFTTELEQAPEELLARVHGFLGVSADFVPDNLGVKYRPGGSERRFAWLSPYRRLSPQGVKRSLKHRGAARAAWRLLPGRSRMRLRYGFDHFGYKVELWNRREGQAVAPPSPAAVARLREHYEQDAGELATLLRASLPWRAPSPVVTAPKSA
ncbi:MAG: sulfotransferase domain-containing protein [Solirubrobacteraceae bacterium]